MTVFLDAVMLCVADHPRCILRISIMHCVFSFPNNNKNFLHYSTIIIIIITFKLFRLCLMTLDSITNIVCLISVPDVAYKYRVEFTVGDKPVKNFRMIERHYFRNRVLKDFDFDFGFCMPNTRNTCEHIYEMPQLSEEDSKLIETASSTTLCRT